MRDNIIDKINGYLSTQPIERAWVFGSFARGEEKPDSDIDIMVVYDRSRPIGLMKIAGMYLDLKELLGREVDLVEEGTLRPWAEESVNRDKKLIYERSK
ncbi:MAG: nucleotidyltransferase family protein [Prevotella sp.]